MKSFLLAALVATSAFAVSMVDSNSVVKSSGFLLSRTEFKSCVECVSAAKINADQHKADSAKSVALETKVADLEKSNDYWSKSYTASKASFDSSVKETKKSRVEGEKKANSEFWRGAGIASAAVVVCEAFVFVVTYIIQHSYGTK